MEDISYRFLPRPSKKISKKNAQTDAVLPFGRYFLGLKGSSSNLVVISFLFQLSSSFLIL